jgi:hypothetical protein
MKAKTLLIAAATLAVGAITSQAQVYSQNIVGYINVQLTNSSGYTMICNQLDSDGTGTNNSIYNVVGTNVPVNTTVLAWSGSGFLQSKWTGVKWTINNQTFTNCMNPGSGFFVNCPAQTNITVVGSVIQGTNYLPVKAGYQIVSPLAPVAGGIQTVNGYSPNVNDTVLVWGGSGYVQHKWTGSIWTAGQPAYNVGQAFFLNASAANVWTNILNP